MKLKSCYCSTLKSTTSPEHEQIRTCHDNKVFSLNPTNLYLFLISLTKSISESNKAYLIKQTTVWLEKLNYHHKIYTHWKLSLDSFNLIKLYASKSD